MTTYTPPNGKLADQFNEYFDRANRASENLIFLDGAPRPPMGCMARRRARYAMTCYRKCIQIFPGSWQSYCFLGKVHQALGEHAAALEAFRAAALIEPDQPVLLREASIEAAHCKRFDEALKFAQLAVSAQPDIASSLCNLAAMHLNLDQLSEARSLAERSVRLAPHDQLNQRLLAEVLRRQASTSQANDQSK